MKVGQQAHVQVLSVVFGVVDLHAQCATNRHELDTNLHGEYGEAWARKVDEHGRSDRQADAVCKVDVDLAADSPLVVGGAHARV